MKLIISYITTIFTLLSCSNFLEQEPGSQISLEEQLSTKKGIIEALHGAYVTMESVVTSEEYAVYADVIAGNISFTPSRIGIKGRVIVPNNIEQVYNFEDIATTSNFTSIYQGLYSGINEVNLIIEALQGLVGVSINEKNQIKAECLAIRAYAHFVLVQLYAQNYAYTSNASHIGIVYNVTTLNTGIKYPKRESVHRIYELLLKDLISSIGLYPNNISFGKPLYSYFNRINSEALLSRVYLAQNNWEKAYQTANNVIQNSGVLLTTKNSYVEEWERPNKPISEILLEFTLPGKIDEKVSGGMAQFFGYESENQYKKYAASKDLTTLFEVNDIRKKMFLERPLNTLANEDLQKKKYFFTKKHQDNAGYPILRLSEMYLIRAEAALRLNQLEIAKENINIIRKRAGLKALISAINLEDQLLLELRKEFCFEGHWFFSLSRNKKSIERSNGCISNTCNLEYPSLKYVLPIPQRNLNLNLNLKQNDSY